MTVSIRMRKSRSEHLAVFMVLILLLSILSVIGPIQAEPGMEGIGAEKIEGGSIGFEAATTSKDIEELHQEVLDELREIVLEEMREITRGYEALQTRMQDILDILEFLRNEIRFGRLAGTDLEPFWNEYHRGNAELDELAAALDETLMMKLTELLGDIHDRLEEKESEMATLESELKDLELEKKDLVKNILRMELTVHNLEKKASSIEKKIQKTLELIEDRRARGKSTKILEDRLSDQLEEMDEVRKDMDELTMEIENGMAHLEELDERIADLEEQTDELHEECETLEGMIDELMMVKNDAAIARFTGEKNIAILLNRIQTNIMFLEIQIQLVERRRKASTAGSPEVHIDTEIVSLDLKGIEPVLISDVKGWDITLSPNPKLYAESALFTHSTDGSIWYVVGFMRMTDGEALVTNVTHMPPTTHYRVTGTNWYGNRDHDETVLTHTYAYDSLDRRVLGGRVEGEDGKLEYLMSQSPEDDEFELSILKEMAPRNDPHGDFWFVEVLPEELFGAKITHVPEWTDPIDSDPGDDGTDQSRMTTPGHKYVDTLTLRGPLTSGRKVLVDWITETVEGKDWKRSVTIKEITRDGSEGKTLNFFDAFPIQYRAPGPDGTSQVTDFTVDSFFDVFYDMGDERKGRALEFRVDSFFDIFTELSVDTPSPSPDFTVDSFFDIDYRIEFNDPILPSPSAVDSFFDITYRIADHTMNEGSDFQVDSFFDITYRVSFDSSQLGPEFIVDSFFDVFYEVDLTTLGDPADPQFQVDSFFDITYEMEFDGVDQDCDTAVDSFFDITYQIDLETREDPLPEEKERGITMNTAHLEYGAQGMRLGGQVDCPGHADYARSAWVANSGGNTISRFESSLDTSLPQTREHILLGRQVGIPGMTTFAVSGESGYEFDRESSPLPLGPSKFVVDSFFDVFFDITIVDDEQVEVVFSTDSFFDVFYDVGAPDPDLDGDGIPDVEYTVDSFFDITYQIEFMPPDSPDLAVDSFFDVFYRTEFQTPETTRFSVDSFFDIDYRIEFGAGVIPPGGNFVVDSFFDVFYEVDLTTLGDPDATIPIEIVSMSLTSTFEIEIVSMDLTGSVGEHEGTGAVTIIRSLSIGHEETGAVTIIRSLGIEHEETGAVTIIRSMVGGGGGSNFQVDSFFDVFTELSVDGGVFRFKNNFEVIPIFEWPDDAPPDLPVIMQSFAVESFFDINVAGLTGPVTASYQVDSFFDINVAGLTGPTTATFQVDSFFDVFTELSMDGTAERGWDGTYKGKVTMSTKMGDSGNFQVDSFFDVFTELSMDGTAERGWDGTYKGKVTMSTKMGDSGDFQVDSFFDIFTELSSDGMAERGWDGTYKGKVQISAKMGVVDDGSVDSFFDIAYDMEYRLSGNGDAERGWDGTYKGKVQMSAKMGGMGDGSVDSFFDVFTELSVDGVDDDCDGVCDELIQSLRHRGHVTVLKNREDDPTGGSEQAITMEVDFRGHVTVLKASDPSPGGDPDFQIDSFFDISYRKILDRGEAGDNVGHSLESSMRVRQVTFIPEIPTRPDLETASVDSFFDVFTEVSIREGKKGLNAVNVKVAIAMDDDGNTGSSLALRIRPIDGKNEVGDFQVDSFFDITYRVSPIGEPGTFDTEIISMDLKASVGGPDLAVDSFFDVFFDITITDVDPKSDTGTIETEIVSMSLSGSIGTNVDSFFDVFVEIDLAGMSGQPDSFFDITCRIETADDEQESRVKVKFPWISKGKGDDDRSSFQVAMIFGDPDFDVPSFRPEVDDEVLVLFESGDPGLPIIVGMMYNDGDPDPSVPPEMYVTVEYSHFENGRLVSESSLHLDGSELTISRRTRTDDVEGLEEYNYEVRLTDLKAGMVPGIKVDTEYIPTGPNRFFSVVSSKVETVNEEGKKETTVETTIDTYEVIFDLATGKETEIIWLFRDVVNVRSSREVRIAADGTETFANEIWIEVQRIKNIG